ncbi:MAG: hypothetical protein ACI82A_000912 [Candidatus Azotimanducaceae bacterium]|jgi:hypothetical protein
MRSEVMKCLCIAILLLGATSCVKVDTDSKMPRMGSELIDLSRAKTMGELTDQEFQVLRRKVFASF